MMNISISVENENDWEFVTINDDNGYHIAVF